MTTFITLDKDVNLVLTVVDSKEGRIAHLWYVAPTVAVILGICVCVLTCSYVWRP